MALGRTKTGRRQQRSAPPTQQNVEAPDRELESYLAALAPEDDVESTGTGRRFGGSEVFQLRLPLMANERLKELAARQGLSPAALAKDWIMQHLEDEPPSATPAWPEQDAAVHQTAPTQPTQPAHGGYYGEETDTEITIPRGGQYFR